MSTPFSFGDLLALSRQSWIKQLTRRLDDLGYRDYRPTDSAAARLLDAGPLSVGQLGWLLGVTRQAARKVIQGLEDRGLATVEPDESDGRKSNAVLTPLGRKYAAAIISVVEELNAKVASSVSPDDFAVAGAVLRSVLADAWELERANLLVPPLGDGAADRQTEPYAAAGG